MSEESKVEVADENGFPPELVARVKEDAAKGAQTLVEFVGRAEMPLLVVFALDNTGGQALAWTNAPLAIANDMAARSLAMLNSESVKQDVVKH